MRAQLAQLDATWTLARTDHPDAAVQEEAAALLHCVVRGTDPKAIGRAFSSAAIELALSRYPGFHVTAPPGDASPVRRVRRRVRRRAARPARRSAARRRRGSRSRPPAQTRELGRRAPTPTSPDAPDGPTRRCRWAPSSAPAAATRAATANVGVWARTDDAFAWLANLLTVELFQWLLPETARCRSTRHVLPNLRALNFVVEGVLGEGVASNARHDPQAKALGEWLRSRTVDVPRVLAARMTDRVRDRRSASALRDTVRRFVERDVLPYQDEWERDGELPRSLHARAAELGLIGALVPGVGRRRRRRRDRRAGARRGDALRGRAPAGCSPRCSPPASRCRTSSPPATPTRSSGGSVPPSPATMIGSLAITEPDGGSDVAGIRTSAKRDGDEYVINGAKTYITSGVRADFVVTAVRTGDVGAHGISLLVVEKGTPGFTVSRKLERWAGCARTPPSCPTPTCACRPPISSATENSGFVQIAQNFVSRADRAGRAGLRVGAARSRPDRRVVPRCARRSAGR